MKNFLAAFFLSFILCGCIPIYKPWNGDQYNHYSKNSALGVSMGLEKEGKFRNLINGDEARKNAGLKPLFPHEKLFFDANLAIYEFYKDLTFEELKQAVKNYEPQDEDFFLAAFAIYEHNRLGHFVAGWIEEGEDFESFKAKIAKRFFLEGEVLYLKSYCPGFVNRTFTFKKRRDNTWELVAEKDVYHIKDSSNFDDYSDVIIEYDAKNKSVSRVFICTYPLTKF